MIQELRVFEAAYQGSGRWCPINTPWTAHLRCGLSTASLQKRPLCRRQCAGLWPENGSAGAVNLALPTAKDLRRTTMVRKSAQGPGTRKFMAKLRIRTTSVGVFRDSYDRKRYYKTWCWGPYGDSDNLLLMYRGRSNCSGWVFKATCSRVPEV
jgi:hypothetical protein